MLTRLAGALMPLDERERGATIVEYGIVVAVIAIVSIFSVATLGDDVLAAFTRAETQMPVPGSPTSHDCCRPDGADTIPSSTTTSSTTTSTTTTTTTTTTTAG